MNDIILKTSGNQDNGSLLTEEVQDTKDALILDLKDKELSPEDIQSSLEQLGFKYPNKHNIPTENIYRSLIKYYDELQDMGVVMENFGHLGTRVIDEDFMAYLRSDIKKFIDAGYHFSLNNLDRMSFSPKDKEWVIPYSSKLKEIGFDLYFVHLHLVQKDKLEDAIKQGPLLADAGFTLYNGEINNFPIDENKLQYAVKRSQKLIDAGFNFNVSLISSLTEDEEQIKRAIKWKPLCKEAGIPLYINLIPQMPNDNFMQKLVDLGKAGIDIDDVDFEDIQHVKNLESNFPIALKLAKVGYNFGVRQIGSLPQDKTFIDKAVKRKPKFNNVGYKLGLDEVLLIPENESHVQDFLEFVEGGLQMKLSLVTDFSVLKKAKVVSRNHAILKEAGFDTYHFDLNRFNTNTVKLNMGINDEQVRLACKYRRELIQKGFSLSIEEICYLPEDEGELIRALKWKEVCQKKKLRFFLSNMKNIPDDDVMEKIMKYFDQMKEVGFEIKDFDGDISLFFLMRVYQKLDSSIKLKKAGFLLNKQEIKDVNNDKEKVAYAIAYKNAGIPLSKHFIHLINTDNNYTEIIDLHKLNFEVDVKKEYNLGKDVNIESAKNRMNHTGKKLSNVGFVLPVELVSDLPKKSVKVDNAILLKKAGVEINASDINHVPLSSSIIDNAVALQKGGIKVKMKEILQIPENVHVINNALKLHQAGIAVDVNKLCVIDGTPNNPQIEHAITLQNAGVVIHCEYVKTLPVLEENIQKLIRIHNAGYDAEYLGMYNMGLFVYKLSNELTEDLVSKVYDILLGDIKGVSFSEDELSLLEKNGRVLSLRSIKVYFALQNKDVELYKELLNTARGVELSTSKKMGLLREIVLNLGLTKEQVVEMKIYFKDKNPNLAMMKNKFISIDSDIVDWFYILSCLDRNPKLLLKNDAWNNDQGISSRNLHDRILDIENSMEDSIAEGGIKSIDQSSFSLFSIQKEFTVDMRKYEYEDEIAETGKGELGDILHQLQESITACAVNDQGLTFTIQDKNFSNEKEAFDYLQSHFPGELLEHQTKSLQKQIDVYYKLKSDKPNRAEKVASTIIRQFNNLHFLIEKEHQDLVPQLSEEHIGILLAEFLTKEVGLANGGSLETIFQGDGDKRLNGWKVDENLLTVCQSFDALIGDILGVHNKQIKGKIERYFNQYIKKYPEKPQSKLWGAYKRMYQEYNSFEQISLNSDKALTYSCSIFPKTFAEVASVSTMGSCLGQDIQSLSQKENILMGKIELEDGTLMGTIIMGYDKATKSVTIYNLEPSTNFLRKHSQGQLQDFVYFVTEYVRTFATSNGLELWHYDFENFNGSNGNFSNKRAINKSFIDIYGSFDGEVIDYGNPSSLRNGSYKFTGGKPLGGALQGYLQAKE